MWRIHLRLWYCAEDRAGNLWLSTFDDGVLRLDAAAVNADEPRPENFQHFTTAEGLLSNNSGVICPDNEGSVWVGSDRGLQRLLPQTVRFYARKDGLAEDNIYPILQDRSGRMWLGAWTQSLIKYDEGRFAT
jgi:ligand-binding sensor domain-containing protein